MMQAGGELVEFIAAELGRPVSGAALALVARLRDLYGDRVRGVLFYGSCLRKPDDLDGVFDLYVLVDRYRGLYRNPLLVLANALLPPNVFYLEAQVGERTVRAKYAVLSRAHLLRGTSPATFEPYFWARFAQPCALVYASDAAIEREVSGALAQAVVTFVLRGVALLPERFRTSLLWRTALSHTYRCEVRSERAGAPDALYLMAPQRYQQLTRLALPRLPYPVRAVDAGDDAAWEVDVPTWRRRAAPCLWWLRRWHGKTRFLLRLLRNGLIFEGGVDYVMWKIERHSGVKADPTWRDKRLPLLALAAEVWRLLRRGAFR